MNIKVTRISNKWHARLFNNDIIIDEMACKFQSDIGWICREMMTWADKGGYSNKETAAARIRHNKDESPTGKIWRQLNTNK